MKKFSLIIMLLMAFTMAATAQNKKMKIAVMDFKAGVGVNANEVEGLSDMLINTMYESGKFNIVERSQIKQVLKEWDFQASEHTNEQLVQVGRILGVESVLIGTVNFLAEHKNYDGSMTGEYNVDIRAVDVESGEVVTTAGAAKSSGSTYRAMMEKIARQLAKNLTGDNTNDEMISGGLITKGGDFYYLDGKRLTNEQYMELIQNCPEAWTSYEKGRKGVKTGRILFVAGLASIAVGAPMAALSINRPSPNRFLYTTGCVLFFVGIPTTLTSIPIWISGSSKKNNAYKVYNQYCSKPTASLSLGPATNGIGMGVYLNF
jgi:hypothetical protein